MAFPGASVPLPAAVADAVRGAGPEVVLGLRPEALHLSEDGAIGATVIIVELLGAETHVICHTETGARSSCARAPSAAKPKIGEAVRIAVDPDPAAYHLFDAAGGARLGGARDGGRRRAGPPRQPTHRPGRRRACAARRRKQALLAYLLILPAMVLFGVFSFYPFLRNFKLMLYETPPVPGLPAHYVGLHQIIPTITSTPFTQSLVTTLVFVVLVVPISLLAGLGLAVAAHRKLKGMAAYRLIFSSTVVSSVAVAAVVFGTLLNPVVGLLPWLGINPTPPALESSTWALPAVALLTIWQFLGLSFIIMSAGLQSVPDELLEAARIDGAGPWTRFWRMTVPLLSPTIFFAGVISTIYAFQAFGAVDILIGNQNAARLHTNVLIYNIVTQLQIENNDGAAAIMAIVLFLILLVLTILQMRFLERRVTYAR